MVIEDLYQKAKDLPLVPGVYLMYNREGIIIYIGKAKKLRNRVSQYFTAIESHNAKTYRMVTNVDHFEVIIARTEFEALILECTLIKQHKPKYNILLKDDKGYPYIRIDSTKEYPKLELVSKRVNDSADYYGPYGGRYLTQNLIDTINHTLKLPLCSKSFPRDVGKGRPCLNYHMNLCDGWCRLCRTEAQYQERIAQAVMILQGKHGIAAAALRDEMERAAENLEFEYAAELRDRMKAMEALKERTLINSAARIDLDVIGYRASETKVSFCVLHYIAGTLLDKDLEIIPEGEGMPSMGSLVEQYYVNAEHAPKQILVPEAFEDMDTLAGYLTEKHGHRVEITNPQRGEKKQMLELSQKNAAEELDRLRTRADKALDRVSELGKMLFIPKLNRIESYDISHISGTDIVASMVVFENGALKKSDYKRFKLENMPDQDDYYAMRQVLTRRLLHYQQGDEGFAVLPDLFLIDGGAAHAAIAEEVLEVFSLNVPAVGMVKDNRHRTRALIYADERIVEISGNQMIFSLIGQIQEETHRFAITYHRSLRSKRLASSKLDEIPAIGVKRKELLLKHFKSVKAIENAELEALEAVLPDAAARSVYVYFHPAKEENEE